MTVSPEIAAALMPDATITLQVRTPTPASARTAVEAFADGLRGRDPGLVDASGAWLGPKYVGPVVPLPDGPALTIDVGQMPDSLRDGLPARLAGLLADAGVTAAEIIIPPNDMARYLGLRSLRSAARALIRGPAGAGWQLTAAEEWFGATPPRGLVLSTPVEVPAGKVAATLAPMLAAETTVILIAGADPVESAVAAEGFGRGELALMHAGPGWPAGMRRQRDLARRFAGRVDWAGVTADADADRLLTTGWWDPARPSAEWLADALVPDAMWFQVLSPGHINRLGEPPEGAEDLGEGRHGLTIGDPEQWLPTHPDSPTVRARARALLAACLSTPTAVAELNRTRR
ncbi:hypothetical protein ACFQFC_10395 [Amorphoplanes digitatis]|uniref:Uncharacterized protein n=1 Tax=Actinoplanes digitatis TaxID=1868 RepID=A0A7W7I172_9ACTN|nr:hypothetical protein [Actinoplanes digitatis]MBB4764609.1 hypothetical protein [Actinoplanes digitatis]GID91441.1 hypothetical protein Adi01nite_08530 [Actinoplanes digitatis]